MTLPKSKIYSMVISFCAGEIFTLAVNRETEQARGKIREKNQGRRAPALRVQCLKRIKTL
jgi:hypothetical protein